MADQHRAKWVISFGRNERSAWSEIGDQLRAKRGISFDRNTQAVNSGDIPGILACWAPDGVLLPPHHPLVRGHAAMAEYFDGVFATRRLTFTFTDSVVTIAEDFAIERLTFTARVTVLRDGTTTEDVGKGLHVFARQRSGGWKLVQDIWNSDRALPARDVSSSGSSLATP